MNPRFEKAAREVVGDFNLISLPSSIEIRTSVRQRFDRLSEAHDLALRCLENLNRNGSVSPQLAAEALAAIKGEA